MGTNYKEMVKKVRHIRTGLSPLPNITKESNVQFLPSIYFSPKSLKYFERLTLPSSGSSRRRNVNEVYEGQIALIRGRKNLQPNDIRKKVARKSN